MPSMVKNYSSVEYVTEKSTSYVQSAEAKKDSLSAALAIYDLDVSVRKRAEVTSKGQRATRVRGDTPSQASGNSRYAKYHFYRL